ncbi:MAG: enoyl-CoA hydratase/isomerase family protein [Eubacteriales bacterium]
MEREYIKLETEGKIAFVTIDRPKTLNAIDGNVLKELNEVFGLLEDDPEIRVIVLTGAGEKAFVAGGDIAAMRAMSPEEGHRFVYAGHALLRKIEKSNKVVIAMVNGYALGGGTEIAMACDLRFASEKARFGLPEVSIGLFPGWGGTQRMARLAGKGVAKELVFTGKQISADEAYRIGLVNKVFPHENLKAACVEIANQIIANSPIAVRQAKKALNDGTEMSMDEGITYEAECWLVNFATRDRVEGLSAFLEKRKPEYQGK